MKNYIWDFDGMLFDSYPHITKAFQHAMADFGKEVNYTEAKSLLEIKFDVCYNHYGVSPEMKAKHKEYEHDYSLEPVVEPFPHTFKTLFTLKERGVRHYLYTHRGHETSQHYLEKFNMAQLFDGFVDSDMKFPDKPAPDAIEYICTKYGLDKSETIMIGDREIDVLAGKNAGVFACLYTKDLSTDTVADYKVSDIIQILDI